jgi:hypothetical protein
MKWLIYSVVVLLLAAGTACNRLKAKAEPPPPPKADQLTVTDTRPPGSPPLPEIKFAGPSGGATKPEPKPEDKKPDDKGGDAPSFTKDVKPFLAAHCVQCHNGRMAKAGYNFEGFDGLMKGGRKGPAVVAGEPDKSVIVRVLSGQGKKMPPPNYKNQPRAKDVTTLKAWISAGAKDDSEKAGE